MNRKLISALCVVLMLCAFAMPAYAAVAPDLTEIGSIFVIMEYEGQPISDGAMTLYHVAGVRQDGEDVYSHQFTGEYADCDISLDDISSAEVAKQLANYTIANTILGTEQEVNENGKISFENLQVGLYLLIQSEAAEGYNTVSPFLVTVPCRDKDGYYYDVDATPKMEPIEPEPTEPSEPTDPSDPSTPIDPSGPTDPSTPTGPSTPTDPSTTPTDPSNPTDPSSPTDPSDSTTSPGTSKPGDKLPQTGLTMWPIPILAVIGLGLFILGWYLHRTGKKEIYES